MSTTETIKPYIFKKTDDGIVAVNNEKYWKEVSEKKYQILLKKSGIPQFYYNIEFKNYKGIDSKESFEKAKKYANECFTEKFDYVNLYLYSKLNSSQKTAIMCNVGKAVMRQGKRVKFLLAGHLTDLLLKNSGYSYREDIVSELNEIKKADMILIDDIFDSKKSIQWSNNDLIVAELDKFLRDIFSSDIKTVMTSNISIQDIEKNYGKSMKALIERNAVILEFNDSIRDERINRFQNLWD